MSKAYPPEEFARILSLRDQGMTWEDIARTLPDHPDPDLLRKRLAKKGPRQYLRGRATEPRPRAGNPNRGSRNPERDDKICRLWKKGLSGGEIAMRMGITRNAVMGAVHRYGADPQDRQSLPNLAARGEPRPARISEQAPPRPTKLKPSPAPKAVKPPLRAALPLPTGGLKSFLLATYRDCSFPMWSHYGPKPLASEMIVCGRPRKDGASYCEAHAALCLTQWVRPPPAQHRGAAR